MSIERLQRGARHKSASEQDFAPGQEEDGTRFLIHVHTADSETRSHCFRCLILDASNSDPDLRRRKRTLRPLSHDQRVLEGRTSSHVDEVGRRSGTGRRPLARMVEEQVEEEGEAGEEQEEDSRSEAIRARLSVVEPCWERGQGGKSSRKKPKRSRSRLLMAVGVWTRKVRGD